MIEWYAYQEDIELRCQSQRHEVMDLARRMAQANPHQTIEQSEAIVLIDEVDLHLHPIWQQHILVDLMATFPKAQFYVKDFLIYSCLLSLIVFN